MFSWALRTLWRDRRYALAAAAGVAVALLLVLMVEGMFVGESRQITAYPEDLRADLWVAQHGVSNMHMATSFIDAGKETRIRGLEGVASTSSLVYVNGLVSNGGQEWFAYIVGIHPSQPEAGPALPMRGTRVPEGGETVIPEVLADKLGVELGDAVRVANRTVRVAGIMDGYFSMANSIAFVEAAWLQEVLEIFDTVSYIVVRANQGVSVEKLARRIEDAVGGVEVVDNSTFLANDRRIGLQMGGELIGIMSVVSAIVATLLVAWCVMAMIARYQVELAVARAVGAGNGQVVMAVTGQAVAVTGAGYLISLALGAGLEPFLDLWAPGVAVEFPMASYRRNAILSLAIGMAAAALPAWRVISLDPATVFK